MIYTLPLAVGIHQLLELGCGLDLEEDLLSVLNIEFLTWLLTLRLSCSLLTTAAASVIRLQKNIY